MKSQSFVALTSLVCSLVLFVSLTEAGIFGRRQSYSNSRPTYTYRPAAQAVQPAAPVVKPATAPVPAPASVPAATRASTETTSSGSVDAQPVSMNKPEAPRFHPTILSMLTRNNSTRMSRGLRPMLLSGRLTAAAQNHANYMASTGGFSHHSNGGVQGRAATYGFRGGVRENIAMGQPSVESAFNTWTASGGHYANMMSHSDVAGFGYAVGSNGQAYWVAVYGNNDGGN
jgi:uncharacterized protein YkwD